MSLLDLLIIEDSTNDAHLLKRIIKKEELTDNYHWAKNGEAAIDFLFNSDQPLPLFILLDIKLSKVSGFEILKLIRKDSRTKHIPVIMYSSSYQPTEINKAYELGANSYLVKPTEYKEMKKQFVYFFKYWKHYNKRNQNEQ